MKWRSSTKKEGSNNSRRDTLESYEQKYLEKFNKVKSEIQKIQKQQKDLEVKELKDTTVSSATTEIRREVAWFSTRRDDIRRCSIQPKHQEYSQNRKIC